MRWDQRDNRRSENGGNLAFHKVEISSPIPVAMMIYSSAARGASGNCLYAVRQTQTPTGRRQEKVQHPQRDVWQLFTKQKLLRVVGVT